MDSNISKSKKVALFGGTFDPVHQGHLNLALEIRDTFQMDQVLLVPANRAPHKFESSRVSNEHRLEMLKLAVGEELSLTVSDLEIRRKGVSYTVDTLNSIKNQESQIFLYLVIGLDMFREFHHWKDYEGIMKGCHVLVAFRPGYSDDNPLEYFTRYFGKDKPYEPGPRGFGHVNFQRKDNGMRLVFFSPSPHPVASRDIRRRIYENRSIKNMLPPLVENYIIEHHLYQANPKSFRER